MANENHVHKMFWKNLFPKNFIKQILIVVSLVKIDFPLTFFFFENITGSKFVAPGVEKSDTDYS